MPQNFVKIMDHVHLLPETNFAIYFVKYAQNEENFSS